MPISIVGAVQQKKISLGKQVNIEIAQPNLTLAAKLVELQGETLYLKVEQTDVLAPEFWVENAKIFVSFVVFDDAIYSFEAEVFSYNEITQLLKVRQSAPIKRREQRSDYRLKTAKIIHFKIEEEPLRENWQKACLLDLSRGGASILTTKTISNGDDIFLWIPLDEVDYVLNTQAKVVRSKHSEEDQCIIGVSFKDLTLLDQEKILDYILQAWEEKLDD